MKMDAGSPTTYVTTSWDDGHQLDLRARLGTGRVGVPGTFYIAPRCREIHPSLRLAPADLGQLAGRNSRSVPIRSRIRTSPRLPGRRPDVRLSKARKQWRRSSATLSLRSATHTALTRTNMRTLYVRRVSPWPEQSSGSPPTSRLIYSEWGRASRISPPRRWGSDRPPGLVRPDRRSACGRTGTFSGYESSMRCPRRVVCFTYGDIAGKLAPHSGWTRLHSILEQIADRDVVLVTDGELAAAFESATSSTGNDSPADRRSSRGSGSTSPSAVPGRPHTATTPG